jgi:hypothetical protein
MSPETTIEPVVEIAPTVIEPVERVSVSTLSEEKLLAVIVDAVTVQKNASPGVAFVWLAKTLILL